MKKAIVCLLLIPCCLLLGCSLLFKEPTKPSLTWLKPDVEREIKIGMNVDAAKVAMESLGFKCTVERNAAFSYKAAPSDITPTKIENVDFLDCWITEVDGFLTETLTVFLLLDGDAIEQVIYKRELSGL